MRQEKKDIVLLSLVLIVFVMLCGWLSGQEEMDRFLKTLCVIALMFFIAKIIVVDFKASWGRIQAAWSGPAKTEEMTEEEAHHVAIHEAGHAVVEWFLPHLPPPQYATIVPNGNVLGHVESHPCSSRFRRPSHFKDMIAANLASHATEKLILGEVSTACKKDIQQANKLAEDMVLFYGMGKGPSLIAPGYLANATAWHLSLSVAQEVERIVGEQYERATKLVAEHRSGIERVASALLKRKTLKTKDLEEILGPRSGKKQKTRTDA